MRDFQFYVTDDHYSAPSLMFVQTRDASAALALAKRLLNDHGCYRAVDVWDGDERLFRVKERA